MSRKTIITTAVLASVLAGSLAAPAMAGKPRTHDRFFLRLSAGGGWGSNKIESGGDKLKLSGFAGDGDVAVGAMVRPNLALHGTLFGWAGSDPDLDVTVSGVSGSGTAKGTAAMSAAGAGLTYYFMPSNAYVSGSIGAGSFMFDPDSGSKTETNDGLAFELTAGKEWWVGNSWGLGFSGSYIFSSLPDKNVSPNWSGNAFGVRFSATFN